MKLQSQMTEPAFWLSCLEYWLLFHFLQLHIYFGKTCCKICLGLDAYYKRLNRQCILSTARARHVFIRSPAHGTCELLASSSLPLKTSWAFIQGETFGHFYIFPGVRKRRILRITLIDFDFTSNIPFGPNPIPSINLLTTKHLNLPTQCQLCWSEFANPDGFLYPSNFSQETLGWTTFYVLSVYLKSIWYPPTLDLIWLQQNLFFWVSITIRVGSDTDQNKTRCDSYLQIWNYHSLTDPLTGVGARRCYRI